MSGIKTFNPRIVLANDARVSAILQDMGRNELLEHLEERGYMRVQLVLYQKMREQSHRPWRDVEREEFNWLLGLYPSAGSEYRARHGFSKRLGNQLRLMLNGPIESTKAAAIEAGLAVVRARRRERKKAERKARQQKHRETVAARAGKVRTKHVVVKKENKKK